jgi:hypothetical protein
MVTVLGMIPYAGLSFSSFDHIKHHILSKKVTYLTEKSIDATNLDLTVAGKLVSGAFTAMITQTFVYPMDVVRSHMQLLVMLKDPVIKE